MDKQLQESIIKCCQRIIEQNNMRQAVFSTSTTATSSNASGSSSNSSSSNNAKSDTGAANAAFSEAVRVLDTLCTVDKSLLPRLLPRTEAL